MPTPDPHRQALGRLGAHVSWANTVDRTARTRKARSKSPASPEYWLARLDAERFANATPQQRLDAAEAMRRAHFAGLALRSAESRRGGDAA